MKNSNIDFFESFIKPKRFNDTIKGLTIYAEDKDDNGLLKNIYIKKDNERNSFQITYAKSGKFKGLDKNKILELHNGRTISKVENKISNFSFAKSDLSLSKLDTNIIKSSKIQETSTFSHFGCINKLYNLKIAFLNKYEIELNCSKRLLGNIFKELYKRLIIPFYIPVLIMISMLLIIKNKEIINYSRYRILIFFIGFITIIFSETSLKFIETSLTANLKIILFPIIFFIFFYLFTAFFAILSIPLVLFPRKYISYSLMIWSNFKNYLLYFLFKIDYKIYGKINTNQVIYAIQHQSIWETIVLAHFLPGALSIVIQQVLISLTIIIFIFKKFGAIPLNRGKQIQSIRTLLSDAQKAVKKGHNK